MYDAKEVNKNVLSALLSKTFPSFWCFFNYSFILNDSIRISNTN